MDPFVGGNEGSATIEKKTIEGMIRETAGLDADVGEDGIALKP